MTFETGPRLSLDHANQSQNQPEGSSGLELGAESLTSTRPAVAPEAEHAATLQASMGPGNGLPVRLTATIEAQRVSSYLLRASPRLCVLILLHTKLSKEVIEYSCRLLLMKDPTLCKVLHAPNLDAHREFPWGPYNSVRSIAMFHPWTLLPGSCTVTLCC